MIARDTVCLVLLCTVFSAVACPGADYYVDAISGNDRNTGRGPQVAWQTIHKVNSYREFVPGDRILLRRGQIWREQLVVSVSGTADRPIRIGAYGTGARPTLKGSDPILNWSQTSRANCWRASLAVMPNQVFFNGTRGVRQGAPVHLDKPLEWTWSDGMLYVYAGSDPGGLYEFPGVEASVHPSTRSQGLLHIKDQEFVTVQDIDISQSYGFGIYIKPWAHDITIQGCDVGHSLDGGLVAPAVGEAGASQITVEDCLIHHNNGGFKEGAPGVATYHEGLTMENVDGFVVRRTQVYNNYMEGVNFKRGARNGVMEYCDLYSNDLINLYIEGASDIVIRYNRIHDCTYNAGIEFGLETNAYHNDRVRIHHNLFWGNSGAISFWAAAVVAQTRNITIDNNTFYNNEYGVRWKSSAADNYSGANYIRNNLFWPYHARWVAIRDQTAGRQALAQTTIACNVFQKSTATDVAGSGMTAASDARLVNPALQDFHLRSGSVCIDGGTDVGLTRDFDGNMIPQGLAPDIGAYEYPPGAADSVSSQADSAAIIEDGDPPMDRADPPVPDVEHTQDEAAGACDDRGNAWILWHAGSEGQRQVYASRSGPGLAIGVSVVPLTGGQGDSCNPAVAMDGDGTLYAAWQENVRGVWDVCVSISVDGDRWSVPQKVADTGGNQLNPSIAAGSRSDGTVAVAWQDDRAGNQDVYVLASSDRFSTGSLFRVTVDEADQTDPAIAVDSEGTIVVVWTDARNGSTDIYGAASNQGPWTNVSVVDVEGDQSHPAIAAGSCGRVLHVVWADDAGGDWDIFYVALNGLRGGSLAAADIIDDVSHADQTTPEIAVTAREGRGDRVVASWQDGRDGLAGSYWADLSPGSVRTNRFVEGESPAASRAALLLCARGVDDE